MPKLLPGAPVGRSKAIVIGAQLSNCSNPTGRQTAPRVAVILVRLTPSVLPCWRISLLSQVCFETAPISTFMAMRSLGPARSIRAPASARPGALAGRHLRHSRPTVQLPNCPPVCPALRGTGSGPRRSGEQLPRELLRDTRLHRNAAPSRHSFPPRPPYPAISSHHPSSTVPAAQVSCKGR